jgi:vacuolar iron transporter family protein
MSNPLGSWQEEQRSAFLYDACARAEAGSPRAELFRRLAGEAAAQAAIWQAQLTARGHAAPGPYAPDLRTRLVAALVAALGPRRLKAVLAAMKVRGMVIYGGASIAEFGHVPPHAGARFEHRHRRLGGGGNLRAAVFGINDGLVSNASLILGVAGAHPATQTVLVTGIAGMCAGAFAMAAGEYVSVRAQRELFEYQIGLERDELAQYPEAEAQELALIYAARGIPPKEASRLANRLIADPDRALDTLAREELGLNPGELGSPWGAAVSSFLTFAAGAVLPLAPFALADGSYAMPVAITVTAMALFSVGALLSLFTGRNAIFSGARMLLLGGIAGGVTFAVGRLAAIALG